MTSFNNNGGCLGALFRLFSGSANKATITYPYRIRDDFLSPAEISLYHVLTNVVGANAVVMTKIRLADIFFVQRPHEHRAAFYSIAQRHVDFLLCHPDTIRPLLGIELDDTSHSRVERVKRDVFIDQVFAAASLPLLHIKAQKSYNTREIEENIRSYCGTPVPHTNTVTHPKQTLTESPASNDSAPPSCPKCGEEMVLRIGTKGAYQGKEFFGCSNYPKCRTILPIPPHARYDTNNNR